jgi:rod shape-determining protein MreD
MTPTRIDERMELSDRSGALMSWRFLSALVPVLCGFLAVLVSNLPLSLTNGLVPAPLLGLVPIYFWCLVRPDLMTPAAVFSIGLFQDIMAGGPPGVWTLSFVITYAVIERQREAFAGLSGLGAVLGFATAALIASACAYATVALYYWHMPQIAPIVAELAVTVLFYIPGALVVGVIHRRLVGPLRSDF